MPNRNMLPSVELDYGSHPSAALSKPCLQWLTQLVKQNKARDSLEVGLGCGISAAAFFCAGIHTHTAIEKFAEEVPVALNNIRKVTKSHQKFQLIQKSSDIALPALARRHALYDIILVDGGHRFDDAFIDVHFSAQLVRHSGIMMLDDTWMSSVKAVISWIETNQVHIWERRFPPRRLSQNPDFGMAAFIRTSSDDQKVRSWRHFRPFRADQSRSD